MLHLSGRRAGLRAKPVALAVSAAFLPWNAAHALPTGEQVVTPGITITQPSTQSMQITQPAAVPKGIINWNSFSIGASEHVNVTQPSASAALLNRVTGNSPSEIFGRLTANGQVFLVNNAGVLFAPSASVEVGSLLASTLSITDQNFLNGTYQFFNPGNAGSVVNKAGLGDPNGRIVITDGGFTALIGPQVRNDGLIIANAGQVALAAGNVVSLTVGDGLISVVVDAAAFNASVVNTGTIQAEGGTVLLKARSMNGLLDTVINTSGVIRASSLVERNGEIVLNGGGFDGGRVAASGHMEAAKVEISGGSVELGGAIVADTASVNTSGFGGLSVSQTASGSIEASHLDVFAMGGSVDLTGPNRIAGTVSAMSMQGGFSLRNTGDLTLSASAFLGDVTVSNAGAVNVVNSVSGRNVTVTTTGAGSDLTVTGSISSIELMNVNVDGALSVTATGMQTPPTPGFSNPRFATVNSLERQDIFAKSIHVSANDGAFASISSGTAGNPGSPGGPAGLPGIPATPPSTGNQTITVTGGAGIVVEAQGGGMASISQNGGGNQAITVLGGGIDIRSVSGPVAPGTFGSFAQISSGIAGNPGSPGGPGIPPIPATPPSTGSQTITVTGGAGIVVEAQGGGNASISQNGGGNQDIAVTGGGIDITSGGPGSAQISNGFAAIPPNPTSLGRPASTGLQTITVTGGAGIDLEANGGGNASINQMGVGAQLLDLTNAGHIKVNGLGGSAVVFANGGMQEISTTGGLTVGSVGASGLSQLVGGSQDVSAGSITIIGADAAARTSGFITLNNPAAPGRTQTIEATGPITIVGGNAPFQNILPPPQNLTTSNAGFFHNSNGAQTIDAGGISMHGGIGVNSGAFISSNAGGEQSVTVPGGTIAITGGDAGTGNRAGITTNAKQTITGNPNIVLAGGAAGVGNNVFIQGSSEAGSSENPAKLQTINAGSIQIVSGMGTDASATINAARQAITTSGDVSLFGSGGAGGANGARIGGIGGTTLGPTNLNLNVGGNLLVHGGTANGASLGSSGASTQANVITVSALSAAEGKGNIELKSDGAGARIGSPNPPSGQPVAPGSISVTAAGTLKVGSGTAIRAGDSIPPTANPPLNITLTANTLVNDGTITNGGATNTGNVIVNANAFDLDGGNIQGGNAAVILRPRDGARSFGIEAAGDTMLTNADLAKINTTNFIVFGSGMGTTFTGDMTIGQNTQVNGGTKSLAFFRSTDSTAPVGTITIGAHGLTTGGGADVIVSAGNGRIVSEGGRVIGDEVQLRAARGIGAADARDIGGVDARVKTDANVLSIQNSAGPGSAPGSAFVQEANDVTLRTTVLQVGGNTNTANNFVSGSLDFAAGGPVNVAGTVESLGRMNVTVAGALTLDGSAGNALLLSSGGQMIEAHSLSLTAQNGLRASIENSGGNQSVEAIAGGMSLQVAGGSGVAQIINSGGDQEVIATEQLDVLGGAIAGTNFRNSGIFKNGPGLQTVRTASITLRGADSGISAGAQIGSQGNQEIHVTGGDIDLIGGNGGTTNNAAIVASPVGNQDIYAHNITLRNGTGGTDTVAGIFGGHQRIDLTGNVTLTSQGALVGNAPGGPGVRIGAPGSSTTGTDLDLYLDGSLTIQGGVAAGNGAAIGSTGAVIAPALPVPNDIYIEAASVALKGGSAADTGVRIGSGSNALAAGRIEIHAATIVQNDPAQSTSATASATIRTLGNVTLDAGSIIQGPNGSVRADTLTTTTTGSTTLTGPNQITQFRGTSGGALTLVDAGSLEVLGITTTNAPITLTTDSLITSGAINNGGDNPSGSANTNALVILNANAFNLALAGGEVQAGASAVAVWPRTSTNLFLIESGPALLGQTSLSNADIAKIHTSNFLILGSGLILGSASGLGAFTGNMTIGEDAQVDGGNKNLAFFRTGPGTITNPGTITIGAQGVTTDGDVIVNSSLGRIVSNGGPGAIVAGDEVQLRATLGIGESGRSIQTDAAALTILNSSMGGPLVSGNAFVSEVDDVTLRSTAFNVNNVANNVDNFVSGALNFTAGGNVDVAGPVTSLGAMSIDAAGALNVTGAGAQDAVLRSRGGQTITAHSVNLTAQDGRRANIENLVAGNQSVTATLGGMNLQVPGAFGVAQITNTAIGGNQTVSVAGQLNVQGGVISPTPTGSRNSGIFKQAVGGMQTVSASGIKLEGASSLTQAGALINSLGDQTITVTGGDIELIGGSGGTNNHAQISAAAPGATQTIIARNIDLKNGVGGVDTFAGFFADNQTITATGNVTLTSQGAIASNIEGAPRPGVRIGAPGASTAGTNLTLSVGANLEVNGSTTTVENGAAIGSTAAVTTSNPARPNRIDITAGGTVTLNAGTQRNTGVRIGSGDTGTAGGNITIRAGTAPGGGSIALNGEQRSAAIRTTDSVSLEATSISQSGARAAIEANALTLNATGDVTLMGANRVASLSAPFVFPTPPVAPRPGVGDNLKFNNTGALSVNSAVESGGSMELTVAGALNVTGAGASDAVVRSQGGQTITAQSVNVTARDGRRGSIENNGSGEQKITTGTLDVQTQAGGGIAEIRNNGGGQQVIAVSGDHLSVQGLGGGLATLTSGGNQWIAMTSPGAKRITLGGDTALGSSSIFSGGDQTIDGNADLFLTGSGSGIVGPGGNARIDTAAGRSQTIHAGTIVLANALNANSNTFAGLTSSHQTITASGDVIMTAGQGTHPGAVRIQGSGATDLDLNIGGSLLISGGNAPGSGIGLGSSNVSNNITVNAGGDVIVNSGTNGARIGSSSDGTVGGNISISARSIQLNGTGASAAIRTLDSVTLSANRPGGTISESGRGLVLANSLTTSSYGDTNLAGPNQVANFNGSSTTGDVTLNNTAMLNVTGVSAVSGTAAFTANGAIALTGAVTAQHVALTANGGSIEESGLGAITADSLTTVSTLDTSLNGANQLKAFNATSGGDVTLNNTVELNVTGMIAAGDANISNFGDVTVSGLWDVEGTSTITAHSDIVITGVLSSPTVVLNAADGAIREDDVGSINAETLTTFSLGKTELDGPNNVEVLNSTSTGGLTFENTAPSFTLGEIETNGGAFKLEQTGDMTVTNAQAFREVNWAIAGSLALLGGSGAGQAALVEGQGPMTISVGRDLVLRGGSGNGAFAKILGYSDINLTVGGFLTMQAGTGQDAYARIQTASRDSTIYLTLPNLASGGFTINGYTDVLRDGKTGFLSETGVAAPEHQLILKYLGQ